MEKIIRKVVANYFDTSKETQTQQLSPNYNTNTFNDFIDYDQQEMKSILPVLISGVDDNAKSITMD